MATTAERILEAIRYTPLDDDELARRLNVSPRQTINQAARGLEAKGKLRRYRGSEGKIVNALVDAAPEPVAAPNVAPLAVRGALLGEDEVKSAVRDHLETEGFSVTIAWGRERGIDIEARHPDGRRWVIEAKGEVASDQQQGNYFLNGLAELIQRMSDPGASYGLALPDNGRYRGLARRLPELARDRLGLAVFWVVRGDERMSVRAER